MPAKKDQSTFADTLTELETLSNRLENNDTPLEQSLKDFEHGVQLIRQAQKSLLAAEQKVQILLEKDNSPLASALDDTQIAKGGDKE